MKITKDLLRKDLPQVIYKEDGTVNNILALWTDIGHQSNLVKFISKWCITNTLFYNANPQHFEGWIELEL